MILKDRMRVHNFLTWVVYSWYIYQGNTVYFQNVSYILDKVNKVGSHLRIYGDPG